MMDARTATMDDLDAMAGVLADAFFDDPVFAWFFPDAASRPRLIQSLCGFLGEHLYLPMARSTITEDAAALWQPPGVALDDGFWLEHGAAFVGAVEGQIDRLTALSTAMEEHHPVDQCWYLFMIGVRPSAQGRGLGGNLLSHTLALADAAGDSVYLEATSPRSRVLYERNGFDVIDEFSVDGSPTLWPMWRGPR
jgi:GNAT superfamily N-acetyltransferase